MTEAVLFDSGWVDSREHLGINYPDNGRIQFRRVTSCAPIPAEERYSDGWTINPQDPNDQVKSYYLGPKLNSIDDGFGNATMTVERKSWNASIPYSPKYGRLLSEVIGMTIANMSLEPSRDTLVI
jgi:hypothetical protein